MDNVPRLGFCFPGSARLKKRWEFKRLQDRGRRIWSRRFILYVRRGATKRSRIGITVSRKVGNAVRRNRIKRWIREVYRLHPQLSPRPLDIVVIAKRGIDDFSYDTIRDELIDVFNRYAHDQAAGSAPRRRSHRGGSRRRGHAADDGGGRDRGL